MNNVTINITVQKGGKVNVYNNPVPYRQVISSRGVVHTFYSKEDFEAYNEERGEQR